MKTAKIESSDPLESLNEFELPDGWNLLTVGEISSAIQYGYTESAIQKKDGPRFLRITDIQDGRVNWDTVPSCEISKNDFQKFELKKGDIVFARTGATTGKSFLIQSCPDAVFASYLIRIRPNEKVVPKFLHLFFQTPAYWQMISENVAGIAQPNCNASKLKNMPIPLPPLAEQQRIVARVEALLTHIDAAHGRLSRVPLIMKRFRQSVLAAACEGRLTEGWRMENPSVEEWNNVEFFDFCVLQRGYDLPIATCIEGEYPVVSSAGIVAYHNECKAKSPCVSMGRSGSIGNIFYIEKDFWPHNTALYVKDFKGNMPKFVYYYLRYFDPSKLSASTAVPTMNRNNLRGITIDIPPLAEQHEIVRRVGLLFERADAFDQEVAAASRRCERLTMAVLGKAFRGELTANDSKAN